MSMLVAEVTVKALDDSATKITIALDATTLELMVGVKEKTGVAVRDQTLYFKGQKCIVQNTFERLASSRGPSST